MSKEQEMVCIFKALGDENRIRILKMLQSGEKCACKLLEERGYTRDSQAYFDEDKREYYLIISECSFSQKNSCSEEYAFILEYGCRLPKEDVHFYIIEHCRCICDKNAVELLSQI